ncbi:hypothetical protein [Rahnella woolbedingensis]|uniref:Uncharacterized protein n=1 Tax=Rahnella woolbedingensis TaxID=1510574 RepID=A0A419N2M3_9GAMM|nr:hypothetical protein [Rahnella woolbedingensis]RJT35129.1 hypothetical protein D6C13_23185 [Rahnella woolbedingensis]
MSYTHVLVKMNAAEKAKPLVHVESDLDENFVVEHIIKPFINGEVIFIDGSRARSEDIAKISVYSSEKCGLELHDEENGKIKQSSARARANRIFSGNVGMTTLSSAIKGEGSQEITRKVFNQAMGVS